MWRWLRRVFTGTGRRFCSTCGRPMDYSILARHDGRTGLVSKWQWAAACPESSVMFTAIGGWSGNGHSRSGIGSIWNGRESVVAPVAAGQSEGPGGLGGEGGGTRSESTAGEQEGDGDEPPLAGQPSRRGGAA